MVSKLTTYAPLLQQALRVPFRRAFSPRDPGGPVWSPKYEILVRALRQTFVETANLTAFERRAVIESLATPSPLVWKLRRENVDANGVPGTWFLPPKAEAAPVILFLHGGAYQFGSVRSYTDLVCRVALASNLRVLAIDYRLAPEHPFPAPLADAMRAYEFLRSYAYPVVLMGDSAGGNLAVSLAIALREKGAVMPKSLALVCPWVDLHIGGESRETNASYDTVPPGVGDNWALTYAAGHALDDPRVSPAYADLSGLPPMLVHAGGRETIRDEVRAFVARARSAGVEVEHSEYPEMVHDWHLLASFGIPESLRAIRELATFARAIPRTT